MISIKKNVKNEEIVVNEIVLMIICCIVVVSLIFEKYKIINN